MNGNPINILGIESSCDETAASVFRGPAVPGREGRILANVIASQKVHEQYGGVVPELASRAHQHNIVPVIHEALKLSGLKKEDVSAIAFTRGPGLLGSLLVGASFAKGFALGTGKPLIAVNHLQGHVLAHFIDHRPQFPFLCLTVSGGHTQIVLVKDYPDMQIIGKTLDDAAGEAFDKTAKIFGLPYPGGPLIDKYAQQGNNEAFHFPHPKIPGLDFSFSGLKTSVLYFVRDRTLADPLFVQNNLYDLCASVQKTIIDILLTKLSQAASQYGINEIAIAGGVAANSGLRNSLKSVSVKKGWKVYIPQFQYCTDNAAMIAVAGYFKYLANDFAKHSEVVSARIEE